MKFWLGKGIDGFRIDAMAHIYESDNIPDEPLSNIAGATNKDYGYLNHIYTKNDPRTYELLATWRKLCDEWSDSHNELEKVNNKRRFLIVLLDFNNKIKIKSQYSFIFV